MIQIDKTSKTPVYRQMMQQLMQLIRTGALKPGFRLPSTRKLAESSGVNRSTVYKAYQELWAMGFLESNPGSYTLVRKRPDAEPFEKHEKKCGISWDEKSTVENKAAFERHRRLSKLLVKSKKEGIVNFISLSPDPRLFPISAFRKCMNNVLHYEGEKVLQYGDPSGHEGLRRFIASRMREHGVSLTHHEIMITTGAQNAVELLLKLFSRPGDAVAVESPTYSNILDMFSIFRMNIIEIPFYTGEKVKGMDLSLFETVLKTHRPLFLYTIPSFHNPTGMSTDQKHREALLELCMRYKTPIVEDAFEEELKYFGKVTLPIKSMDKDGIVIYIGTFSKTLFPGLRIGWIAADRELLKRLAPVQKAGFISGNLLDQAALSAFCSSGLYDIHIRRMHQVYRKRMKAALESMERYMPAFAEWSKPAGGYTIWVKLKNSALREDDFIDRLMDKGIAVFPGSVHYVTPPKELTFRLSIAHLDEEMIRGGIARLSQHIEKLNP